MLWRAAKRAVVVRQVDDAAPAAVIPVPPGVQHDDAATATAAGAATTTGSTAEGAAGTAASVGPAAAVSTGPSVRKKPAVVSYWQLYRYATRNEMLMLTLACFLAACNGVLFPLFTLIFGQLLNAFNSPDQLDKASSLAIDFFYLAIGTFFASFVEVFLASWTAERQMLRIRALYLDALLRQDMGWHDTHDVGELVARLAEDTVLMQEGIGEKLSTTIHYFCTFIAGVVVGFTRSWELTLITLAFAPFLVALMGVLMTLMRKYDTKAQSAYAQAGSVATEAISLVRTVSAYSGEDAEVARYDTRLSAAEAQGIRRGALAAMSLALMFVVVFFSYGVALKVGASLILSNRAVHPECRLNPLGSECFSGGTVVLTFMATLIGVFSLGLAAPNFGAFGSAQAAAYHIFEVIDTVPAIDPYDAQGEKPGDKEVRGRIEFRNVSFAYFARVDASVLKDLTLTVEPGECVALVGASGSGKSTVIQLLQRNYDVTSGEILVDGHDIRQWNVGHLRNMMGLVLQEPMLFGVSVRENICYGLPGNGEVPDEEVIAAAKAAFAHDFIMDLPNGYDTIVGSSVASTQLSGGQRQRICIARAIIRNPHILLLDEATAALDPRSEHKVQEAIDHLVSTRSRTTIMIAHRLSTIVNADRIVILKGGEIVEIGKHSELIERPDGAYRALWELQDLSTQSSTLGIEAADAPTPASVVQLDATMQSAPVAESKHMYGDTISHPDNAGDRVIVSPGVAVGPVSPARKADSVSDIGARAEECPSPEDTIVTIPDKPETPAPQPGEAAQGPKRKGGVPSRRVLELQRMDWKMFTVALIGAAASGAVFPLFGWVYAQMITVLFDPNDAVLRTESTKWMGVLFGLAIIAGIANGMRVYGFAYVAERLTRRLRRLTFASMISQDMAFFDNPDNSAGKLATRLAKDAALVKVATGDVMSARLQSYAALITAGVIGFLASWRLTLVMMAMMPLLLGATFLQDRQIRVGSRAIRAAMESAGHVANEAMAAIRTVNAFQLQTRIKAIFRVALDAPARAARSTAIWNGLGLAASQAIVFSSYGVAFLVGNAFIRAGTLTFQDMLVVFLAITFASQTIGRATNDAGDRSKAEEAKEAIFEYIDLRPSINACNTSCPMPEKALNGELRFENVGFAYPTRPGVPALTNFNLTIHPGETVALVGESGSGKSTIVGLLERWYDASSGRVLVDGMPITSLPPVWLRRQIGFVQQEPALFGESVLLNIIYGSSGYDADHLTEDALPPEISEAARKANALGFVLDLPDKFHTPVGERGSMLSGGQRQRVAISRAFLRQPRILLLDEATSALDSLSEQIVQKSIEELRHSEPRPTVIMIAHRLSTVRQADRIVVLQRGQVIEVGTFEELWNKPDSKLRSLAAAQETAAGPDAGQTEAAAINTVPVEVDARS